MVKKIIVNKGKYLVLAGVLFLLVSLGMGILLVNQQQIVKEKAQVVNNMCPAAEACPYPGDPGRLWSCHPLSGDGTVDESLCNQVGRVETCGVNFTKWCCPAVNGAWTTNLTMCPSANATPTPAPTPIAPVVIAPKGTLTCPAVSPVQVTFSWNAVSGASYYYIKIDDTSNSWLDNCGTGTPNPGDVCTGIVFGTSYAVSLPANKNYQWWVTAYNSTGGQGPGNVKQPFSIPAVCSSSTPLPTPTPIGFPNWDVDQNGIINIVDIGIILDNYGKTVLTNPRADVNRDGSVDIIDIGIVIDHYNR